MVSQNSVPFTLMSSPGTDSSVISLPSTFMDFTRLLSLSVLLLFRSFAIDSYDTDRSH